MALYSGWWWWTAGALDRAIAARIAAEQAKGAQIEPAAVRINGWPFDFRVVLEPWHAQWPNGFGVSGQRLRVRMRPWAMDRIAILATGGFAVAVPPGTARPAYTVAGETLRGSSAFDPDGNPRDLSLGADSVSASRTTTQGQPAREMTVATLELHAARPATPPASDTEPGLDASLHLADVGAAVLSGNPLGGTIADIQLDAKAMGKLPQSLDRAGLTAWRDAGGTLDISALTLRWGPLGLAAQGTAALDPAMQPEGAFTAHMTGAEAAVDALGAAGWIRPNEAVLAKTAVSLLAHPVPGGQPTLDTPVTIQNRHISLGAIKVGQVPQLTLD